MRIKQLFSYFPVFIDTDPLTQALEQKSGRSGDANPKRLAINNIVQKSTRIIAKYYNLCNTS